MPVRKIGRSMVASTGIKASDKGIGRLAHESGLEADFLDLANFCPLIESIEVQPVRIDYVKVTGKPGTYTPDALLMFRPDSPSRFGRPWLCEIKYRWELRENWAEYRLIYRAAVHYARERNWWFKILTDTEIRTPFLDNVQRLQDALWKTRNEQHEAALLATLKLVDPSTPEALLHALGAGFRDDNMELRGGLLPSLWRLIATGRIHADLRQPIRMDMPIQLAVEKR